MNGMKIGKRNIEISNPDKLFFPELEYKKKDVIEYYKKISVYMMRHIKKRPISVQRAPDGLKGDIFIQQNAEEYYPDWIDTITVKKQNEENITHVVCNNTESIVYLVEKACVTFHIWLSTTKKLHYPDKLIFDLDPPEKSGFDKVIFAAMKLKDFFDNNEMSSYVMTTGSKGLHVVIPVKPEFTYEKIRDAAKSIATRLADKNPGHLTVEHNKSKRKGRLFLDYLRNSYGVTSVCPYSIRLLENAPVATPIDWKELSSNKVNSQSWNVKNIFRRLSQKDDPWKEIFKSRVSLKKILSQS